MNRPHRTARERGSVTVVGALAGLALLLMAGLVIDGAGKLRAAEQADRIAGEAARAAVEATNPRGPTLTLDRAAAVHAADAYLARAGVTGTVTSTGPLTVQVTVTVHGQYLILGLLGTTDYTVAGRASATLTVGAG